MGRPNYGKLHELKAATASTGARSRQPQGQSLKASRLRVVTDSTDIAHASDSLHGDAQPDHEQFDEPVLERMTRNQGQAEQAREPASDKAKRRRKKGTAGAYGRRSAEAPLRAADATAVVLPEAGTGKKAQRRSEERRRAGDAQQGTQPQTAALAEGGGAIGSGQHAFGTSEELVRASPGSKGTGIPEHRLKSYQQAGWQKKQSSRAEPGANVGVRSGTPPMPAAGPQLEAADSAKSRAQKRNARRARIRATKMPAL